MPRRPPIFHRVGARAVRVTAGLAAGLVAAAVPAAARADGVSFQGPVTDQPPASSNPDGIAVQVLVYLSTPPTAALSSSAITFAATQVGTSAAAQRVTLGNTSAGALPDVRVSGASLGDADPTGLLAQLWMHRPDRLRTELPADRIVHADGDRGARTATLTVVDNAAGRTQTVTLSGSGSSAAVAGLSPKDARDGRQSRRG